MEKDIKNKIYILIIFVDILEYENFKSNLICNGNIEGEDFVNGFLMIKKDIGYYKIMHIPYMI